MRYDWEPDSHVLHDYQRASVQAMEKMAGWKQPRMVLYYRTGAGKTLTSLACVRVTGHTEVTVIAPPVTHDLWVQTGKALGMDVTCLSHAKFRQKGTKLSKHRALIADEIHMFGSYKAVGWKKLESISLRLLAPLVAASATPNYNDVERCFIIQRLTDPRSTEGGYLAFIYRHCNTDVNPWGHVPKVSGFLHYPDAASFLADLPRVEYIEDKLVYDIEDWPRHLEIPEEFYEYNVDRRAGRIIGSQMERRHREVIHMMVTDNGYLAYQLVKDLEEIIADSPTPVLVFATHTEIVKATVRSLLDSGITAVGVTGETSYPVKREAIEAFKSLEVQVLVGTVTLATGTDGLDKMCDTMVILDDTDDDSMRRQLIGRIMPRGHADEVVHSNRVVRIVPQPLPS